jgi:hypothetical protein
MQPHGAPAACLSSTTGTLFLTEALNKRTE